MSVWMVMPTAAPFSQASVCVHAWQERGYKVAAAHEDGRHLSADIECNRDHYDGYARAVNMLARMVLTADETCTVVVAAADDIWPDPTHDALEIEMEFTTHFHGLGVMQPAGQDGWSIIGDQVAWSPWMGREWCERAYKGRGPMWPGYHHYYVDRELQLVAERLGVFWHRPNLLQRHDTWRRKQDKRRPNHIKHAVQHHDSDKELFEERVKSDFPGADLAV